MSFSRVARIAGLSIGFFFLPSCAHSELLQAASIEPGPSGVPAPVRTDIVRAGKDMTAPILIHSVEPRYPADAQRSSSPEIVIVNCYIERDGTTSNVHAVRITVSTESDVNNFAKFLEDSAVEAVKHYKFKPAKKDGKPVPVELNVNVSFNPRSR